MHEDPQRICHLFAPSVLVDGAFRADVTLAIDPRGDIAAVEPGRVEPCETAGGPVVPGMVDLHSHAFQRAMVGLTQRAGPQDDDFWTWRAVMYRFVAAFRPDDVEAIAAGLYLDMLKAGFTTVGEFHYLHNAPDGSPYADPAEMAGRVMAAASRTGIAMTLLPSLYQSGGFGGQDPRPGQRRFVLSTSPFLRLVETLALRHRDDPDTTIGIAPHSLRAVAPGALREAIAGARALAADLPIHLHAAEQIREVDQCVAWSGKRPVEWLADEIGLDAHWCLIHATHTTEREKRLIADAGAVVGLCPTTEADLGDGIFDLAAFESLRGRFGIGTDANVSASPATELRQLEWSQRLATRRRLVAGRQAGASIGTALYASALAGGARGLGRRTGRIAPGCRADLLVLDAGHPLLAGRSGETLLDSWIFATDVDPVRDVMVGGRWVVREGHHAAEASIAGAFAGAMRRLAEAM